MFEVHGEVGPLATPESLRRHLDAMLRDPAPPPLCRRVPIDFGKSQGNWIEENLT